MALIDFLTTDEQQRIVSAITEAERQTSGEICVHVTPRCWGNVMTTAQKKFNQLKLYETERRNAVLIFIAYKSHKFAILGDQGINELVPDDFWKDTLTLLGEKLKAGETCNGLCETILQIGNKLTHYFPAIKDDINELSNEITYED
ncbi:TPM domain-containing protein [Segatella bryantii]|uniref:TPM domain-containing protein n=1 Tax=Segatella bryantii TaxID=77095 RepID=A0ABX4EG92_SEGBR|nr:TPM domain-containing protein [Segatella bryantii]OYP54605.1 hypothetical protein CIK91_08820 [Segatella bryantii]UKK74999.1 TPM domain-containing protein [Segatella bryantii]UKK82120.1 TPM domain-containing protein [Segatella bryantii]SDM10136.1 TLP18.3, Psb32 and MOLO-1 founding protein of phosphatase [Segatella bryantii]